MRSAGRWTQKACLVALGLLACVEGESPIVGREHEAAAGAGAGPETVTAHSESMTYLVSVARAFGETPFCGTRELPIDELGRATCTAYVTRPASSATEEGTCDCAAFGRTEPGAAARVTAIQMLRTLGQCDARDTADCEDLCVCETPQLEGDDWLACVSNPSPSFSRPGWCYVAPEQGAGTTEAMSGCAPSEPRRLRLLGDSVELGGFVVFGCHQPRQVSANELATQAPLGAPCLPSHENLASFSDFDVEEVTLITNTPQCDSGMCLVNQFQGRVSCPYGNTKESLPADHCFLPGSDQRVPVAVRPQLVERQDETAVFCSCRCDGPGDGPFCECPSDMRCTPLIGEVRLPADPDIVGSYCIPQGTAFDPTRPPVSSNSCLSGETDECGDPRPY